MIDRNVTYESKRFLGDTDTTALTNVVTGILPAQVVCSIQRIDAATFPLFPMEETFIKNAVEKRKLEFKAGRTCARRALSLLGLSPTALPVGALREPIWPKSIAGSISHDGQHCISVVAWKSQIPLIGIDLAMSSPLDRSLIPMICGIEEILGIERTDKSNYAVDPYKLIFCLKESVYKCLFPVVQRVFDFNDVALEIDTATQSSRIRLLNKDIFDNFFMDLNARYCNVGNYIFSVVWAA